MYHPPAVRPPRAAPFGEFDAPAPRASAAGRLARAAGRAVAAMLEPLEDRRLLSTSVIFAENFEGSSIAAPWLNRVDPGANANTRWGLNTAKVYSGSQSAFCSSTPGTAGLKRNAYDNDQANALVRDNVSLANFKSASLTFKLFLNTEAGYDYFSVNVIEPSGTKTTLFRDSGNDSGQGWQTKTVDLSGFAGRTGLDLEFRFESDASVSAAPPSGAWIDDVKLTGNTVAPPGSIGGTVFNDADGDRDLDTGESGLGGWVVYLDQNQNGRRDAGEAARTTLADGSYQFTGLGAGTYYVAEEVPSTYVQTSPGSGGASPSSGFRIDVNFPDSSLTATQKRIFAEAAGRWAQVITGDVPDVNDGGTVIDDLRIDATGPSIDGAGSVLGQSAPTAFRNGSLLPYRGFMEFDSADLAALEKNGQLLDVITHEMGHVLGFGTLWMDDGLLSGEGGTNPRFTGKSATAQYNTLFGKSDTSVPVEAGGGAGTAGSHWRESVFDNELMSGYLNSGTNPLSQVTIGSMADLGYAVNYGAAASFVAPARRLTSASVAAVRSASSTTASLRDVVTTSTRTATLLAPRAAGAVKSPSALNSGLITPANTVDAMSPAAMAAAAASVVTLPFEHTVTLSAGEARTGVDFGNRPRNASPVINWVSDSPDPVAIAGTVRLTAGASDADGSVKRVSFYRESNGKAGLQTGSGGDTLLGTDSTPADGFAVNASTSGLSAGTYTYYAQATDNGGAVSAARSTTNTVGAASSKTGSIGGTLFHDLDGDGVRDSGESGLAGWRVFLDADKDGQLDANEKSVVTGSDGSYHFTGLAAGSYAVREVVAGGYIRTSPSGGSYAVTLAAGASVAARDFGNFRAASIAGRAFNDANGNGRLDGGEAGLSGVRIYQDRNNNGIFDAGERSALTDSAGNYRFDWLGAGTYVIREVTPTGSRLTGPAGGYYRVRLSSGLNSTGNNFGSRRG